MKKILLILSLLIPEFAFSQTYGRHVTNLWVDSVLVIDSLGAMTYTPANGKTIIYSKGEGTVFAKYRSGTIHNLDSAGATAVDTGSGMFIQSGFFGNGDDGDVTITGNTTLTRDMFYDDLTVNVGANLISGGFRVFVKDSLICNGIIHNNGNNGGNGGDASGATAGSAGSAGAATTAGYVLAGTAGSAGKAGATTGNGTNGNVGTNLTLNVGSLAYTGSNGGAGGAGASGAGGTGGNGTSYATISALDVSYGGVRSIFPMVEQRVYNTTSVSAFRLHGMSGGSGSGGAGGAGTTGTRGAGGGSGGNGSNASSMVVCARMISGTGTISSNGGNGGAGGAGGNATGDYGSGGGGGGGMGGSGSFCVVLYHKLTGVTVQANGGSAGALGVGGTGGNASGFNGVVGTAGRAGLVFQFQI